MRPRFILSATAVAASLLAAACAGNSGTLPSAQSPAAFAPSATSTSGIQNGCFTGTKPWTFVKGVGIDKSNKPSGTVKIVSGGYGSCKHAAFEGTTADPAPNGYYGVEQTVTVTKAGKLSWWYWGDTTESISYGYQVVGIFNGTKLDTCYKGEVTNAASAWKEGKCTLNKYAGQKVKLFFGVFDNGYGKTHLDWYVSDVALQ